MSLRIGEVAAGACVNIETVRYYERTGMLTAPPRTDSGYRQYDAEAIERIRFIKHAQALGFSLKEIRDLLELRVRHGAACGAVERKTRNKIALIDKKLRELTSLRRTLKRLVASCEARETTADCPVLETLEKDETGR